MVKKTLLTSIVASLLALPLVGVSAAPRPTPHLHVTFTMVPGSETRPSAGSTTFTKQWMVDHTTPNDCKPPLTTIHDTGQLVVCVTVTNTIVAGIKLKLNKTTFPGEGDLALKAATWIVAVSDGNPPTPFGSKYEGPGYWTTYNKAKRTDKITTHFSLTK